MWKRAVDDAVEAEADALIVADVGILDYAARRHPQQRLHVSVQAAAANPDAIRFYVEAFGARRVVLPRVLSIAEIAAITQNVTCETEVFIFGGLCVMEEGRCSLSSYVTGKSPNMDGVCSPASHVQYRKQDGLLISRLGEFTINKFAGEEAGSLSNAMQGSLSNRPGRRLSVRGSGQPRCYDNAAGTSKGRRRGAKDRGTTTRPGLYRTGRPHVPPSAQRAG